MSSIKYLSKEEMQKVSVDVLENVAKCCKDNNYTMLSVKKYSDHPNDNYLYIVLAVKQRKDDKEYATWLYNDSVKSLNHGHYITDNGTQAQEDYDKRLYIATLHGV